MLPIRFAIIGCGNISAAHIHAIKAIPDAKLVAVVDMNESRAKAIAAANGCNWYLSVEALLAAAAKDIDAVCICTASGMHLEPAVAAAKAGKHVMVEKPLEVTLERCDTLIETCRQNSVLLGGVLQNRFHAANKLAKEAVAAGWLGRLILGEAIVKWYRSPDYFTQAKWRGTWRLDGGGALINQAIHQVDLLQWIMGPVVAVQAKTRRLLHTNIEVEDTAVAILEFANGALGVIEASTATTPGFPKQLNIFGTQGNVIIEDDVLTHSNGIPTGPVLAEAMRKGAATSTYSDPMAMSFVGHERQLADFVAAIRQGREPAVNGEEARKAVALIMAIYNAGVKPDGQSY